MLGPLAVYALLGSSRQLSIGPGVDHRADDGGGGGAARRRRPGPVRGARGHPGARWSALSAWLARLARLGFLADLLSKPVLVGYMAGVAVIMIAASWARSPVSRSRATSSSPQIVSFAEQFDERALADAWCWPRSCWSLLFALAMAGCPACRDR